MADQILKKTGATLEVTFSAGDASGAVTVTSLHADGTAGPSGTATNEAEAGRYTFVLAPQTELDILTFNWAGTWGGVAQSVETQAEIVGAHLFTIGDLRAFGDRALQNTTAYPDATLREARDRITDLFERVCGVSFIPRYDRDTLDGTGSFRLDLNHRRVTRLIAITVDEVVGVPADYDLYDDHILSATSWPDGTNRNITVAYEHGYQFPPADITWAGMMLARYELVSNDISDRALSFSTDTGTTALVTAGGPMNNPTNLPAVNAVLNRYRETVMVW